MGRAMIRSLLLSTTGAALVVGLCRARPKTQDSWWSLTPLEPKRAPRLDDPWVRNEVDAFVLERLLAEDLAPSGEADPAGLLRRITTDLIGLPPTPEERVAFLSDRAPDAYERLVDRLLASPHYGERQARRWLDVAHYADTHGYDKDKPRRNAWPYRDWVIAAFNDDLPWARFIDLQLAGDVLFPHDPDAMAATGFVVAGPWDFVGHVELREGTRDKRITRMLDRDDMVATAMTAFASLTAACARCHDHKFDPVTQADYYALQACFAGVERGDRRVDSDPAVAARRGELEAERTLAEADRAALAVSSTSPTNGWHSAIESRADVTHWVQVDLGAERGFDRVVLVPARPTDFPDTPGFGFPPRYRVEVADTADFRDPRNVVDRTRDAEPGPLDTHVIIEGPFEARFVRVTATELWQRTNDWVFALAELEVWSAGERISQDAAALASSSIEAGRWSAAHLVDGFSSRASLDEPVGTGEREALGDAEATVARLDAELAELPAPTVIYAPVPREPRAITVLGRGDVDALGELAEPGAVARIPGVAGRFQLDDAGDEGARRLALARWFTDPNNPLTWRSVANRIWQGHFGRGLVTTPNDFGRMGAEPSHPALLDWLACELRDGRRSLKDLHRLIVTSSTYRQRSDGDPRRAAIDGENRFLWRANRRRLDAEELRDTLLALSGELDVTMGGPGFEAFAFEDDHSPRYLYEKADLDDPRAMRRAVYRFAVRSVPDPWLETFDCADPSVQVPVRSETTTPLQALTLFNDPFVLRRAERFAERAGSARDAFERALGRAPTVLESRAIEGHVNAHGLASLCRVLFNTNELLYVD